MDSLLANYASSDDEENQQQSPAAPVKLESKAGEDQHEDFLPKSTSKLGGIFKSLPPPNSSLFNSLPPPKSQTGLEHERDVHELNEQILEKSKPKHSSSSSSSLFSSIPPPKSSTSSSSTSKRVVQFRPPTIINPYAGSFDDEDEDSDEGELERQRKRSKESISTSSATSFLSSIPAPRYSTTLGTLASSSGTGRRSMLETDAPASTVTKVSAAGADGVVNPNVGYLEDQSNEINYGYSSWSTEIESHTYYNGNVDSAPISSIKSASDAGVNFDQRDLGDQAHEVYDHSNSLGGECYYGAYSVGSTGVSSVSTAGSDAGVNYNAGSNEAIDYEYGNGQHVDYTNYSGSYGDYGDKAQYENNWASETALPAVPGVAEDALRMSGRRGRKDAPAEIIEVKQDELIKNRPREDQVKLTGIAFGPAYQPTATKGKPTKLHKRKHQIGSLLFDMRQKEMELAERRSKGYLTKAQTQAKYGW